MLDYYIAYFLCGIMVGFFAGLFGIGGGIIGIPVLLMLFSLQGLPQDIAMHMAIGTLLATVIVTSSASIYMHHHKGMILFPVFKKIILGVVIGSTLGIMVSIHLHGWYLQRIFAIFLLLLAIRLSLNIEFKPRTELPGTKQLAATTTVLGALTGMLGLGGGILMVPYLHWCGLPFRNAIATSSTCILPVSIIGAFSYMYSQDNLGQMPAMSSGFIYWPAFVGISLSSVVFAPLGARISHLVSTLLLKRLFAGFLLVVGMGMLF